MRKVLIGLLVVFMILGLTACSQNIAELMGKMSGNIYGIPADTSAADNAAASVSNSTTMSQDGDGNPVATVDFSAAASITSSISTIKNSPAKTEALQSQLSDPVLSENATAEEKAAVVTALSVKLDDVIAALPETEDETKKAIVDEIASALTEVKASISENPTKAELATVAVLSEVATTVANAEEVTEELITKGLEAYDTLKVISEVSNIDVIKDLKLEDLISQMTKGVSRDDSKKFDLKAFSTTVSKILSFVCTDKQFDAAKYKSFIFQASAIKSSIDFVSQSYFGNGNILNEDLSKINAKGYGFTIDDLGLYAVCSAFVEAERAGGAEWQAFLADFIALNYDAIATLGDVAFVDSDASKFAAAMSKMDTYIDGSDLSNVTKEEILSELLSDAKGAITGMDNQFAADVAAIFRTAAAILVDSKFTSVLKLVSDECTIASLLN